MVAFRFITSDLKPNNLMVLKDYYSNLSGTNSSYTF